MKDSDPRLQQKCCYDFTVVAREALVAIPAGWVPRLLLRVPLNHVHEDPPYAA